jgi:hypothetical protein
LILKEYRALLDLDFVSRKYLRIKILGMSKATDYVEYSYLQQMDNTGGGIV